MATEDGESNSKSSMLRFRHNIYFPPLAIHTENGRRGLKRY